jgi:hypothetical protein
VRAIPLEARSAVIRIPLSSRMPLIGTFLGAGRKGRGWLSPVAALAFLHSIGAIKFASLVLPDQSQAKVVATRSIRTVGHLDICARLCAASHPTSSRR